MDSFIDRMTLQDQEELEDLFAKYIFAAALPFAVADSKAFVAFMNKARPSFKIPRASTVGNRLLQSIYERELQKISSIINETNDMVPVGDKDLTIQTLIEYSFTYYDGDIEKKNTFETELHDYMEHFETLQQHQLNSYKKITSRQYWCTYGKSKFPTIFPIAFKIFSIPASSAASERAWSIFQLIHSKRRNRLSNDKVEMLAFLFINLSIFEEIDFAEV
eukprot:gene27491-36163_t